jgi:hypothetical protein
MALRISTNGNVSRTASGLSWSSAYDIQFWLYHRAAPGRAQGCVYLYDATSGGYDGLLFLSDGSPYLYGWNGTTYQDATGASPYTANVWTRYRLLRESATSLKLYVNGTLTATLTLNMGDRTTANSSFFFSTGAADWLEADVAALKLWTDAANTPEHEYRAPLDTSNLWAAYLFESGALDQDWSANNRDLTTGGTLSFIADPFFTGTGAPSLPALTATGAGTHLAPTYTGSGAPSLPALTLSGSGTHVAPAYTGSGAPSLPALTGAGSATFTLPTYTGAGAPSLPALTATGAGTFTAPTYTGSGAPSLPGTTGTGAGTFTAPTYTGAGATLLPPLTGAGAGTHTAPTYAGTGAVSLPALTGAGAGLFAAEIYSGAGAVETPALIGTGVGSFLPPTYTGVGDAQAPALTASGAGTFTVPVYTGSGSALLPPLTGVGTGTAGGPAFTGAGALVLPALVGVGAGTFTEGGEYVPGGQQRRAVPLLVRAAGVPALLRTALAPTLVRSAYAEEEGMVGFSNKDPEDIDDFELDWTPQLKAGETLTAVAATTVEGDVTVGSAVVVDDALTVARLSAGTLGATARVRCRVTTSSGRQLDQTMKFYIQEA